ncbi:MAG: hypothetical protein SGI88_16630 [Candidatus Hydrogenedentes bacterium]|nr:hypothetical protein [Candidatus Hydrogenedentota bacterium]
MLREVLRFIFSPPPPLPGGVGQKATVRVLDALPEALPAQKDIGRFAALGLGAGVFLGSAVLSFALLALGMRALAPMLINPGVGVAEHVLRPASHMYILCAIPPAIAIGLVAAWFYVLRLQDPGKLLPPIRAIGESALLILAACAPFFMVVKSSVEFAHDAVHINPVFGIGVTSYSYSDIKGLRASLTGPVGGWLPGQSQFVFAIDFDDGNSWFSTWYPYESDAIENAILMRFLVKKSGKLAMPAQTL